MKCENYLVPNRKPLAPPLTRDRIVLQHIYATSVISCQRPTFIVARYKVIHGDSPRYLCPQILVDNLPRWFMATLFYQQQPPRVPPIRLTTVGSRVFAAPRVFNSLPTDVVVANTIFGPIPWGHSSPLCLVLSLWTSMRRRRATVQWRHLVNWHEAARCGEWAQHFSNASCCWLSRYFFIPAIISWHCLLTLPITDPCTLVPL